MTRKEAIKIINCYDIGFYDLSGEKIPADKLADAFDMAIEALQADAVSLTGTMKYLTKPHNYCEVVHCKDCKHLEVINSENTYAICHEHDIIFEPFEDSTKTNFCSWGERREE